MDSLFFFCERDSHICYVCTGYFIVAFSSLAQNLDTYFLIFSFVYALQVLFYPNKLFFRNKTKIFST
jgi:hypothetical protein